MMWTKLDLKRIYTKPKGQQPDYTAPVVLRAGQNTVEDFVRSPRSPLSGLETVANGVYSVGLSTSLSLIPSSVRLCLDVVLSIRDREWGCSMFWKMRMLLQLLRNRG